MEETSGGVLDSRQDCIDCVRRLIGLARQRVYIFSQQLEPELYNDREIYERLNNLATRNRMADIRILAHDTRNAAGQGHVLIHLAQRLPSFASIRTTVTKAHGKFLESWLIADDLAYMRIKKPTRYEGNFESDNRLECKTYIAQFETFWEASQVDQNTRRLSL